MNTAKEIPTVNLFGKDGIAIYLTDLYDRCEAFDDDCAVRVVGHDIYACSAEEAEKAIRREYMRRCGENPDQFQF